MKRILTILLMLMPYFGFGQTHQDTIEIEILGKFSSFNFNSDCSDTVLITTIKGRRINNFYTQKNFVSKKIENLIKNEPGMDYGMSGSNNEYVSSIAQIENGKPIRFITLFRSYETNKIVVIEIIDARYTIIDPF